MSDLSALGFVESAHMPPFSLTSSVNSGFTANPPTSALHVCMPSYSAAWHECECAGCNSPGASAFSPPLSPSSLSSNESSVFDGSTATSTWTPWNNVVVALSPDSNQPSNLHPLPLLDTLALRISTGSASSVPTNRFPTTRTRSSVKQRQSSPSRAAEQQQRRRAQHRALDADRRQKETDAISTLLGLIRQQQQGAVVEEEVDVAKKVKHKMVLKGRKAGRLAVLESSIAIIQQLTSKRTEDAFNATDLQESRVQQDAAFECDGSLDGFALSHYDCSGLPSVLPISHFTLPIPLRLSALPLSVSPQPVNQGISHTLLQSTTSVLSHMYMMVIALSSMVVVDVNDAFVAMTGFDRAELLDQPFGSIPLSKGIAQYPASVAAVAAVVDGHKRQDSTTWRCRRTDGVLFECLATFHGTYAELSSGSGLTATRLPNKMLIMCAPDEIVMVGDANKGDVVD